MEKKSYWQSIIFDRLIILKTILIFYFYLKGMDKFSVLKRALKEEPNLWVLVAHFLSVWSQANCLAFLTSFPHLYLGRILPYSLKRWVDPVMLDVRVMQTWAWCRGSESPSCWDFIGCQGVTQTAALSFQALPWFALILWSLRSFSLIQFHLYNVNREDFHFYIFSEQ